MVDAVRRSPIRLAIVEDEQLYRDLLRTSLERAGFVVVGAFADPASAQGGIPVLAPDVALLDIELGSTINGVEVGIRLRRLMPAMGIVLLSRPPLGGRATHRRHRGLVLSIQTHRPRRRRVKPCHHRRRRGLGGV
jgi:chemotaxis response regulator CheB